MATPHPAVVLGLNLNALGIIRSLHACGVPVIGVDQAPRNATDAHRWMSSRTRLCQKVFYPENESEGLLNCLISLGKSLPAQGILLPSGDKELLCISRNREALSPYFRFRVPDPELVELLANKARFYPHIQKLGAAVPMTFENPGSQNIEEIATNIQYPCLIKPNLPDKIWVDSFPGHKAFVAADEIELHRLFQFIHPIYPDILIQEVIPGPDSNLFFSHVYLSENLNPLAIWTGRKIRQLPIHFGTSTMVETIWVDAVADASVSLLQQLRCNGYASIEFKRDLRDEEYKIMEITPGRTWYPHFLGFGAGINIPDIWYQDLVGRTKKATRRAVDGIRWIDEYRDPIASYSYWKNGELSFLDWIRSFRGRTIHGYASLYDPLPIIFVVFRLVLGLFQTLGRQLRRHSISLRASFSRHIQRP